MAQPLFPKTADYSSELLRRTRTLEERYSQLERRAHVMEENMISHHRKLSSDIQALRAELQDTKRILAHMQETVERLIGEFQNFARIEDVQAVKKYLDYWDPVRFVTQQQVEKIVRDILEQKEP